MFLFVAHAQWLMGYLPLVQGLAMDDSTVNAYLHSILYLRILRGELDLVLQMVDSYDKEFIDRQQKRQVLRNKLHYR